MIVWSQAMAKYVQMVVGMAKEGKTVFNAQMVRRGPTMANMRARMKIVIADFIVSSSRPGPLATDRSATS